jgi:hypothetical protein
VSEWTVWSIPQAHLRLEAAATYQASARWRSPLHQEMAVAALWEVAASAKRAEDWFGCDGPDGTPQSP